jgi:hypothetical protein
MTDELTIRTPDPGSILHCDITFHLLTETDVKEQAEEHGVDVCYLPREGSSAGLIIANWDGPLGGRVHVVSRVQR